MDISDAPHKIRLRIRLKICTVVLKYAEHAEHVNLTFMECVSGVRGL